MIMRNIYFAGRCFWGVEEYFSRIPDVCDTERGYVNGTRSNPTCGGVCSDTTGFAETVRIIYNPDIVAPRILVRQFFKIIDPVSVNRQGNDRRGQYRTGVYYTSDENRGPIQTVMYEIQKDYSQSLAVEFEPLRNFYPAEDYHQGYLQNHLHSYCHIDLSNPKNLIVYPDGRTGIKQDQTELQKRLTREQYDVTQSASTERSFAGQYWNRHEPGIYVDIVAGEPLFTSADKFGSDYGWPSFTKPVMSCAVAEHPDSSRGMHRVKARNSEGDSHLNHVFEGGPAGAGGMRYCVNSAILRFIPRSGVDEEGYGAYLGLLR